MSVPFSSLFDPLFDGVYFVLGESWAVTGWGHEVYVLVVCSDAFE